MSNQQEPDNPNSPTPDDTPPTIPTEPSPYPVSDPPLEPDDPTPAQNPDPSFPEPIPGAPPDVVF